MRKLLILIFALSCFSGFSPILAENSTTIIEKPIYKEKMVVVTNTVFINEVLQGNKEIAKRCMAKNEAIFGSCLVLLGFFIVAILIFFTERAIKRNNDRYLSSDEGGQNISPQNTKITIESLYKL